MTRMEQTSPGSASDAGAVVAWATAVGHFHGSNVAGSASDRGAMVPWGDERARAADGPKARQWGTHMRNCVLVTGAGGYIGTTLVPMLLGEGHKVRAVDRFFFGRELLAEHPDLEVIVEDTRKLTPAHFQGVDAVIDLAAISNDPSGELFQKATLAINYRARVRAARLARQAGVTRYVLPSSCSIYGAQDQGFIADETSPTNPLTTYARANEMAEEGRPGARRRVLLCRRPAAIDRVRPVAAHAFRPGCQRNDVRRLENRETAAYERRHANGVRWSHVRDTSRALMYMLEADPATVNGEIYNVGSASNSYQIRVLGEAVAACVPGGRRDRVVW